MGAAGTTWTRRRLADRDAATVLASLRAWEPSAGCGWQLQAGDLSWALRFEPEIRDQQIRVWWDPFGAPAAVILCDQPTSARCAVNPAYLHDSSLAEAVLDDLTHRLDGTDGGPWIDPPPGPGALTRALLTAGFEPDPDIWLHLWRSLPATPGEPGTTAPPAEPEMTARPAEPAEPEMTARPAEPAGLVVREYRADELAERVALQRAAFPGSSLTAGRYRRLREVPGYQPELDLVAEVDGMLTAFCLAWLGPSGGTALLEPAGTHPDYRCRGYATALITEAYRRLSELGATGVAVVTPVSNRPAVALYRSLGMSAVAERRSYWPVHSGAAPD